MYNSYRDLYRIRPAITSIGTGPYRLRLPKGLQITLDMFVISVVSYLPLSLTVGNFIQMFIPALSPYVSGVILAFCCGFYLDKIDAEGKNVLTYIIDLCKFALRKKHTDGFSNQIKEDRKIKVDTKMPFYLLEDNQVCHLPAVGYPTKLNLRKPLDVKVSKSGLVKVTKADNKAKLSSGYYHVTGKEIVKQKEAPSLK